MLFLLRFSLFLALFPAQSPPRPGDTRQQIEICRACHAEITGSFLDTPHYRTSSLATPATVLGPFGRGPNELRTRVPTTFFRMDSRGDGLYQTAYWLDGERPLTRTERMDIAVGSGRRGQSYLVWRDGLLYQLPVSFFTAAGRWVNSPGYEDGEAHFGRLVPPRCLECHATSFGLEGGPRRVRYAAAYQLGIGCRVCHTDAEAHAARGTAGVRLTAGVVNPARLSRDRQIDLCALCHSGAARELRRPPFTFVAGEPIEAHLGPSPQDESQAPDVHGNQVALLGQSRCFQRSDTMTCSTCHDVHRAGGDDATVSTTCLQCHGAPDLSAIGDGHREVDRERLANGCVDCHMPLQDSRVIRMAAPTGTIASSYRNHRIGIYPAARLDGRRPPTRPERNRGAAPP